MAQQSKSIIDELANGIANAFGMSKPQPQVVQKVEKGKGVIVPKLSPVPTVKMPKNPNNAANQVRSKDVKRQNSRYSNLSKRIVAIENAQKSGIKTDAEMRKLIEANKRAIAAQKKLIDKQKRWVEFMLKKWAEKNKASLKKMDSSLRNSLVKQQMDFLKKQAKLRIKPASQRPAPSYKKKVTRTYSPGRKFSTIKKPVRRIPVRRPIVHRAPVRKPMVRKPIVHRAPVRKPIVRKPIAHRAPVRKPVRHAPVRKPMVHRAPVRKSLKRAPIRTVANNKSRIAIQNNLKRFAQVSAAKRKATHKKKFRLAQGINRLRVNAKKRRIIRRKRRR